MPNNRIISVVRFVYPEKSFSNIEKFRSIFNQTLADHQSYQALIKHSEIISQGQNLFHAEVPIQTFTYESGTAANANDAYIDVLSLFESIDDATEHSHMIHLPLISKLQEANFLPVSIHGYHAQRYHEQFLLYQELEANINYVEHSVCPHAYQRSFKQILNNRPISLPDLYYKHVHSILHPYYTIYTPLCDMVAETGLHRSRACENINETTTPDHTPRRFEPPRSP